MNQLRNKILTIFIFIFLGLLRVFDLNADPPKDLSWSHAIWVDEGLKSLSAKNFVNYGKWSVSQNGNDKYLQYVWNNPIQTYVNLFFFKILGSGFWQLRLMHVIISIVSLGCFYFLGKIIFSRRVSLLLTFLFGINYHFLFFNRLGLYENFLVATIIGSLLLWKLSNENFIYSILNGVMTFVAFKIKESGIIFLFFMSAFIGLKTFYGSLKMGENKSQQYTMHSSHAYYFAGLIISAIFYYVFWHFPNAGEVKMNTYYTFSSPFLYIVEYSKIIIFGFWENFIGTIYWIMTGIPSPILQENIIITTLAFMGIALFINRIKKTNKNSDFILFNILFLFAGILFFSFFPQRQIRFYLFLLPSLFLIAGYSIDYFLKKPNFNFEILFKLLFGSLISKILMFVYFYFLVSVTTPYQHPIIKIILSSTLLSCILFIKKILFLKYPEKLKNKLNPKILNAFGVIIILIIIFLDFKNYSVWYLEREYRQNEYAVNFKNKFSESKNYALAGEWAASLTMLSDVKTYMNPPEDLFYEFPDVTHLVLEPKKNYMDRTFWTSYPFLMKNSKTIMEMNLGEDNKFNVHLIELDSLSLIKTKDSLLLMYATIDSINSDSLISDKNRNGLRGDVFFKNRQYTKAIFEYEKLIKQKFVEDRIITNLAYSYYIKNWINAGEYFVAKRGAIEKIYEEALYIDPKNTIIEKALKNYRSQRKTTFPIIPGVVSDFLANISF